MPTIRRNRWIARQFLLPRYFAAMLTSIGLRGSPTCFGKPAKPRGALAIFTRRAISLDLVRSWDRLHNQYGGWDL